MKQKILTISIFLMASFLFLFCADKFPWKTFFPPDPRYLDSEGFPITPGDGYIIIFRLFFPAFIWGLIFSFYFTKRAWRFWLFATALILLCLSFYLYLHIPGFFENLSSQTIFFILGAILAFSIKGMLALLRRLLKRRSTELI